MIILINGSFGIGKSTVARLLRRRVPRSLVYNPEWAGSILMRLPKWIRLRGAGTDDFQDIDLWRMSVITGVRLFQAVTTGAVIVPMAFSRREYFDEVVAGLKSLDSDVRVFCLRADMATILERLEARSRPGRDAAVAWSVRKARACVTSHDDEHFGEPVNTVQANASQVAKAILQRLSVPFAPLNDDPPDAARSWNRER
jgi:predicted kinase